MEAVHCKISKDITICGFIDLVDVASPPAVSRHLVLPVHSVNKTDPSLAELKAEGEPEDDPSAFSEEGKTPSFCVLLHGALKVLFQFYSNNFMCVKTSLFKGGKHGSNMQCRRKLVWPLVLMG